LDSSLFKFTFNKSSSENERRSLNSRDLSSNSNSYLPRIYSGKISKKVKKKKPRDIGIGGGLEISKKSRVSELREKYSHRRINSNPVFPGRQKDIDKLLTEMKDLEKSRKALEMKNKNLGYLYKHKGKNYKGKNL
jgi:hypothetical protein